MFSISIISCIGSEESAILTLNVLRYNTTKPQTDSKLIKCTRLKNSQYVLTIWLTRSHRQDTSVIPPGVHMNFQKMPIKVIKKCQLMSNHHIE